MQIDSVTETLRPATRSRTAVSLAAIHPRALYRPVPPVHCDDEGYLVADSAVSENVRHEQLRRYLADAAHDQLRTHRGLVVCSDAAVLFEEGNPTAVVSPDITIAFSPNEVTLTQSYKAWEVGAMPALVVEILSKSTWRKDVGAKRWLYEALGIREYWIIDLIGKTQPITGWRLGTDGRYREIPERRPDARMSEVFGLEFVMQGGDCRLRDPTTGEIVPTFAEARHHGRATQAAHRATQAALQGETAERKAAEARVAVLEARLKELERP